ncbi:hypothetical protein H0H87_007392 [Tephrocybe sp. NHM501043]|nr:hypothetical protein H0H87_007392 [Tephrocybe sp. NHM501043]
METTVTIIDDTSQDLKYSGDWTIGGTSNEYNITRHGTAAVGSQVTCTFNGSLIEVFGSIGGEKGDKSLAATSSYTIDNNSTVQFTGAIGTVPLYKQLFFSSGALEDGQHSLVITYTTAGKNEYWLDYFRVTHSSSSGTTPSSAPSSTSTQPSSTAPSSPSSTKLSPGEIAGITVGSCAVVLLLAIIYLLVRNLMWGRQMNEQSPREHTSWFQRIWTQKPEPPLAEIYPFQSLHRSEESASDATYGSRSDEKQKDSKKLSRFTPNRRHIEEPPPDYS